MTLGRSDRFTLAARLCGLAVLALGLAVLAGWLLDIEPLKQVLPGLGTEAA